LRAHRLRTVWVDVLQTLLRVLPFPCRTGLVRIGHPGRGAPVLLTCNFRLTVERVKRALEGIDAYLLVANSRGINVWCAATGGLLTTYDVVSVLKTSGVESLVDHRQVILPQLAATGIEGKLVHEKTGWKVVWGPARAAAIPDFLRCGLATTKAMRTVTFPWAERFEMAVAWAFPISLLALLVFPLWPAVALPLAGLVWGLSLLIFMSFPLYQRYLHVKERNVGFILFDFGERGVPLLLWGLFVLGLVAYGMVAGELSWGFVLRWSAASFVVLLILALDLTGSTPLYKSGLHADRRLAIALDEQRCKGAAFCERVCPKDVFEIDLVQRLATLPRAAQCVQCGACIVQCPFDALYFRSPTGGLVEPDTVRRFKLNLLGSRAVRG
jgi:NAD-dependent dihydropyrimidine dehydrogenase PreA subunit